MKLPLSPLARVQRRRVQDQIALLIQEAIALGISPTQFEDMSALAWQRARERAA